MRHLTSQQFSGWVMGERTASAAEHLRECASCRDEVQRVQASLASFHDSLHALPVPEAQPIWRTQDRGRPFSFAHFRWVAAMALLLVLAAIPLVRNRIVAQRNMAVAQQDALLLEQVDAAVSRLVPAPLEPLAKLERVSNSTDQKVSR